MKKYFYSNGNEKFGPFSFDELKSKNIEENTLIWFEGLDDWKPAKEIKDFVEILELKPPPIPVSELDVSKGNNIKHDSEEEPEEPEEPEESEEFDGDYSATPTRVGMFSAPFSFQGRIRRLEYGISIIIYSIIALIVNEIIVTSYDAEMLWFAYIPLLWFIFAQGAKRCHDIGNSGWYQLIPFYHLFLIFAKGDEGPRNQYGINPKL